MRSAPAARRLPKKLPSPRARGLAAALSALLALPVPAVVAAQSPPPSAAVPAPQPSAAQPAAAQPSGAAAEAGGGDQGAPKLKPEQLQALVAPIALFPDPLLSQSLIASTYPLELIQAQQWLAKNAKLKGDELEKAVKAQSWEPAVQATAMMPDLLKRLTEDIAWTTNLGNAFLAQEQDVMNAVQALRKKAKDAGKLESNDKMKVETQVVESQQVVVIQPASPQVVYVPAYNPTVVWGPPPVYYPYPPVYYPPPPPPGAMLFSFSMGMMMGAAMHGGYCCGCGWGHSNTVVINNNNTFVNHYNTTNNIKAGGGQSNWQHNAQHRGGAPYGDRATATKYGGSTRGGAQGRPGASTMDRGAGAGAGAGAGGRGGAGPSTMDRGGGAGGAGRGPGPSTMDRGGSPSAMDRGGGASSMNRGAGPSSMDRGGGDIGNRSVSPSAGGSAFGGSGGSANRAQAASSRGSSSMAGRSGGGGGGGARGGGGGRGGGRR